MLASFQGLSWLQRWKGTPDSPSERTRRRRHRARFGVESLEPRWLLSTMAASGEELEPAAAFIDVSADSSPTTPSATLISQYRVSLPDDWATAHFVPVASFVQVNGNPSLEAGPDLFEVYVSKGTSWFEFTLKSAWDDEPVAEGIQVLDANLKQYANYAPTPNTQAIVFTVARSSDKSSSLFVKISLPAGMEGASGRESNSFPYILEITRHWIAWPQEQGAPTSPQDDASHYDSYPLVGGISIGPDPGPAPDSNPGSPDPNADSPLPYGPAPLPNGPIRGEGSATISLPVPVGPLPVRSAAPLGGALAPPDSVPPVDRHEPARADLAAFDPARALENVDLRPRQVVPVAEPEAVQVITLRGPGGLPLLATALIAGSTVAVRSDTASTAAQGKAESVEAVPATRPVVTQVQATSLSAEQTSLTSSSRTTTESSGRTSKRSHRSSVVPGLTLAFALGIGLVLPDLVASLQFLAPSRPLLRLRLIRRAFKGR